MYQNSNYKKEGRIGSFRYILPLPVGKKRGEITGSTDSDDSGILRFVSMPYVYSETE